MGFLLSICTQPSNDQNFTLTIDMKASRRYELKNQSLMFSGDYNKIRVMEGSDCIVYSNEYPWNISFNSLKLIEKQ